MQPVIQNRSIIECESVPLIYDLNAGLDQVPLGQVSVKEYRTLKKEGEVTLVRPEHGLMVTRRSLEIKQNVRRRLYGSYLVEFLFDLDRPVSCPDKTTRCHTAGVTFYPFGASQTMGHVAGESVRQLVVTCKLDWLAGLAGQSGMMLPEPLNSFGAGGVGELLCQTVPMNEAGLKLAEWIYQMDYRQGYDMATCANLVRALVSQCLGEMAEASDQPVLLARDEIERLENVRERFDVLWSGTVTLDELVEQTGLTEERLIQGFEQRFGLNLMSYLEWVRVKRAQRLIRRSRCRLADIAGTVGYENLTEFSAAFKRHYGCSPRSLRGAWRRNQKTPGKVLS